MVVITFHRLKRQHTTPVAVRLSSSNFPCSGGKAELFTGYVENDPTPRNARQLGTAPGAPCGTFGRCPRRDRRATQCAESSRLWGGGVHPEGRHLVLLGDLIDRGPDSPSLSSLWLAASRPGNAQCVMETVELNILRNERMWATDGSLASANAIQVGSNHAAEVG